MRYIKGSRDPERKEEGGARYERKRGGEGEVCKRDRVLCTAAFIAKGNLHFRRVGKSVKSSWKTTFSSIPTVLIVYESSPYKEFEG